jgi:hypothetical protein
LFSRTDVTGIQYAQAQWGAQETQDERKDAMKIIMPEQAHDKIKESHGKIFTVVFRRKRDKVEKHPETGEKVVVAQAGDLREMNCRTEVKSKLKTPDGEGKRYVFSEHDLVSVYDLRAEGYRSFAWKNVISMKINGEEYVVISEQTRDYCQTNPDSDIAETVKNSGIEI